jgi:hypothetical protein
MRKQFLVFVLFVIGCFPKVWTAPSVLEKTTAPVFVPLVRDMTPNGFPADVVTRFLGQSLNAKGLQAITDEDIARGISTNVPSPNATTSIFVNVLQFQWRPIRVVMRVEAVSIETAQTYWQVNITYEQRARRRDIFPSELAQIIADQVLLNTAP